MEDVTHPNGTFLGQRVERRLFLRRAVMLGVSLPAAGGLLAACAPNAAPPAAPKQEAPAAPKQAAPAAGAPAAAPAKAPAGGEDLTPIIEGARSEGQVVAIGNSIQFDESKKALADAFRTKYGLPGNFQVDILEKNLGEITKQIQEETQAGKQSSDVAFFNTVARFADMAKQSRLVAFDAPEYSGYTKWDSRPGFNNRPYYVSDLSVLMSIAWNKESSRATSSRPGSTSSSPSTRARSRS